MPPALSVLSLDLQNNKTRISSRISLFACRTILFEPMGRDKQNFTPFLLVVIKLFIRNILDEILVSLFSRFFNPFPGKKNKKKICRVNFYFFFFFPFFGGGGGLAPILFSSYMCSFYSLYFGKILSYSCLESLIFSHRPFHLQLLLALVERK